MVIYTSYVNINTDLKLTVLGSEDMESFSFLFLPMKQNRMENFGLVSIHERKTNLNIILKSMVIQQNSFEQKVGWL